MSRNEEITHKIMSSIPSKNTRPEIMLRKELYSRGMRYRINYKQLPGKPDIVFTRTRIAVFVDGDFWHGHNWAIRGYGSLEEELQRYSEYWRKKIQRNIQRDKEVNEKLASDNWTVLRFWESELKEKTDECVECIITVYKQRLEGMKK